MNHTRNYIQTHTLADIRLALGYAAVLSCAATAYYEYKVGFNEAKSWSMLGVGMYIILNIALYLWGYFIEGDIVYVGKKNIFTVLFLD
jgi:signal peptidase complex subunit 2